MWTSLQKTYSRKVSIRGTEWTFFWRGKKKKTFLICHKCYDILLWQIHLREKKKLCATIIRHQKQKKKILLSPTSWESKHKKAHFRSAQLFSQVHPKNVLQREHSQAHVRKHTIPCQVFRSERWGKDEHNLAVLTEGGCMWGLFCRFAHETNRDIQTINSVQWETRGERRITPSKNNA